MNAIGHIFDTIRPPKDMAPEAMEMLRDAKNEAVKKGAFAETIDPQLALDKASSKTPEALAEKAKFPAIYAYLENAAKPADVDTTLGAEGPITSKIGYALTIPERAIAGIHTLGYSLHYGQEIARRAYRSAVDAGMIPDTDEFNTQVAKFTQRTPLKDIEEAHDEAIKMLMMKRPEYGTFLHTLIAASNRNVFAKLMLPFAQLASNRILLATEHTPFAYMLKDSREDLNGKNGGLAQDRARAKIATGTALAGLVIGLAAEGIITPNYSTDPKQRRNQQEQGFKPYSLKVGNVYIPLPKFLGQYGPLIGTFADLYHVGHLLTHEQHEKVAVALTASIGQNITDETFAGGISNAVQAAQDPAHFERYVGGIGMGLIPYSSGLNQLTKFTDPYHREAHGILEQIRAGNPLTSPSLYPTRDQWGERMASGTQSSFSIGHNDRVTQWLEKLDTGLTPVPKQIDNVKLTEGQYDEYAKLAGRTAKQMLIKLMNSNIQSRPPSEQVIKIKETVDNARNIARQTLKGQYPNIIKDANAAKRNIRTGHIQ